jgi:hypothetical protein
MATAADAIWSRLNRGFLAAGSGLAQIDIAGAIWFDVVNGLP